MIVTTDPDEFMDLAFALAYMPLPPGKRIAVATMGGGWGVLVSDEIDRCGLKLAALSPEVVAGLNGLLPPYWSHANPVDLVATITPGVPEAIVELLVASDEVDAVLVMGIIGSMSESRRAIEEIERLKRSAADGARPRGRRGMRVGGGGARVERAGARVHRPDGDAHGPVLQADHQHLVQADDPGGVLRWRQVLHLRAAVSATGGANPAQDG